MTTLFITSADLPWSTSPEDQRRFRRILITVLALTVLFGGIMPLLSVPPIPREKAEQLPPRLAKLILEKKQPPPPPAVVKAPEPEKPKAEPKPEPKPKPKPKPEAEKPKPKAVDPAAARKKAERSGLLALKDELADLRDSTVDTGALKTRKLQRSDGDAPRTTRSIITANAGKGSGGINTGRLSRDTGGADSLSGRAVTQVDSSLADGRNKTVQRTGSSRKAARTVEEIQLVFDKNKGAIYSLYNRALRQDPTLQGKVVLKLTIAPSGHVLDCSLVSSELKAPDLIHKLLARVKLFNFGAKDVDVMVVTYPIDFLPS